MKPLLIALLVMTALTVGGAGGYWLASHPSKIGITAADSRAPDHAHSPSATFESTSRKQVSAPLTPAEVDSLLKDPLRSLDAALVVQEPGERRHRLLQLGEAWARSAPEDAWHETMRIADPQARRALLGVVIPAWAAQQPEKAFASVAELPAGWERQEQLRSVSMEIARRDPLLAFDLLSSIGLADPDTYRTVIVEEWSRHDPATAAQWVGRLNMRLHAELAYRVADAYVGQHPQEALDWALGISQSSERRLWAYMLGQMAVYEPREALRIALAADNPAQRNTALARVLPMIATTDPGLAMSMLDKVPAGNTRRQVIGQIAVRLAQSSPARAVDWVTSLQGSAGIWNSISDVIAWRDPDAAAELLDRVPQEVRTTWITNVASAYAQSDPAKAVQWVRKFENDAGYLGIVREVTDNVSASDPESALDMLERLVDGKQREQILASNLRMVASRAPELAVRLADDLTDKSLRSQALGNVARAWVESDPAAARKWAVSLPAGSARDHALMSVVEMIDWAAGSAEDVLSLIGQIQSPDLRRDVAFNAAMNLSHTDPEAARALLRRYPLDPQRHQQFEEWLKQRDRPGCQLTTVCVSR